jgi:hypothetical protein
MSDVPRFNFVIKIRQDMTVDVYKGDFRLSSESLHWLLGTDCMQLSCWSQLSSALSHFAGCARGASLSVKDHVKIVDLALKELVEMVDESDEFEPSVTTRLQLLYEQILLLFKSQVRYSSDTLIIAFRLFPLSASVYRRLRSLVLSLPHVSYLKRLSSVFSLSDELTIVFTCNI